MARNRVIYQSEALFVSRSANSTSSGNHTQLNRVQSANFSYTINKQDINQFGELARIDSIVLDPPTVNTDFSYYLTDGFNEQALGFYVKTGASASGQFVSGHMVGSSGKNIFVLTGPEGKDVNGRATTGTAATNDKCIGIGNCYLSDYSVDLSVGAIPTVSVTMEGANINGVIVTTGADGFGSIATPAIDQEAGTKLSDSVALENPASTGRSGMPSALRPGDITVSLTSLDSQSLVDLDGAGNAHVQSVALSVPLSRTPLQRLGSNFPFAREVDFPVEVSLSISAVVNETTAYNLADQLQQGEQEVNITIVDPDDSPNNAVIYTVKGCKVDSESFSSAIGSNQTVDITLTAQIGGIDDTNAGLFMSGSNTVDRTGFNQGFDDGAR